MTEVELRAFYSKRQRLAPSFPPCSPRPVLTSVAVLSGAEQNVMLSTVAVVTQLCHWQDTRLRGGQVSPSQPGWGQVPPSQDAV